MSGKQKDRRSVANSGGQSQNGRADSAGLDERLQAHIGSQLKSMYDAYLSEPIPDRIVELLEKLDEASKKIGSGKRGETRE